MGDLFAGCMIAMVLGAVVTLGIAGGRPTLRTALVGCLLAELSFLVLVGVVPAHACHRGATIAPELLGALLAGAVLATVRRRWVAVPVLVILLASGHALTLWGVHLVHDDPYVGNAEWPAQLERISSHNLKAAQATVLALSAEYPDLVLPEGWIEESWQDATGEAGFKRLPGYVSGRVGHFWHTWFTGIYWLETRPNGIWCPGGPVTESAAHLRLRDRQQPAHVPVGTE